MRLNCMFNNNKKCNSCGECDTCDLTPGKKCNNCGKCLEMEGYDMKAIQIDQVLEEEGEFSENSKEASNDYPDKDTLDSDVLDTETEAIEKEEFNWNIENVDELETPGDFKLVYIDDVEEIKGVIEGGEIIDSSANEAFPGLIIINRKPTSN